MNTSASSHDTGEVLAAQRRRVEVCVRFEKAWRAGERPRIETVCHEVPEAERMSLLYELVGVEVELRVAAGEQPTPEEYCGRFPELAHSIPPLFEEVETPRSPATPRKVVSPDEGPRPRPDPSYNLLFGLLAFQNNFIDRDALLAAFNTWVTDKTRAIGTLLVERGVLDPNRHAILEALVQEHLKQHGDDPERSLAALSSIGSMRQDLEQLDDSELTASVAHVSAAQQPSDPDDTSSWVGSSTLRGDRYRILSPFDAQGNLGELFVAHDLELHREVLLKQVKDSLADHDESRARFLLEAEITGNLEHPGIVPVYGLGKYANGRPFYAMRRIQGRSLKDAIAAFHQTDWNKAARGDRTLAFRKLLRHFVDVCNTVAYAHSRGILHRDLKPANIMLGPYGETIVIDWGLAKPVGHHFEVGTTPAEGTFHLSTASGSPETVAGSLIGTPQFMSPEQAARQGDRVGPPSDVYSLGATLYVLLTGTTPFRGSVSEVLGKVQRGEFVPPCRNTPDVPRALEAVCLKAMALRPEDRYASPADLAGEIEHWMADEPVTAGRESLGERFARWVRHHKPLVTGAIISMLILPTALAVILMIRNQRNIAEARRDLAEEKAQTALQLKLTQEYLNLIKQPDESERKPGWTWDRLLKLEQAARIDVAQRDPVRLRTELADCLGTVDLRPADSRYEAALALGTEASCLTFSPDGRFLAIGQHKTTAPVPFQVRILDLKAGSVHPLRIQPVVSISDMIKREIYEGARVIKFTPSGTGLVIGTRYGWLHHWNLSDPDPQVSSWRGHTETVTGLEFSLDGKWLFSSSEDRALKRWKLALAGPGKTPPSEQIPFERGIPALKADPEGSWLACVMNGKIDLVDAKTFQRKASRFPIGVERLAVAPDGRVLAASTSAGQGSKGARVLLLELEHDEEIRSFQDPSLLPGETHLGSELDLEFSRDGSLLMTASKEDADRTVKVWGVASGRLLTTIHAVGSSILDTCFSPDGRFLAITTATGAALFDLGGVSFQAWTAHQAHPISALCYARDGQTLACATEQRNPSGRLCTSDISLWNTSLDRRKSRHVIDRKSDGELCTSLTFHPGGQSVASSWTSNRIIAIESSGQGNPTTIEVEDPVAIGFGADGGTLWVAAGISVRSLSYPQGKGKPSWSNTLAGLTTGRLGIHCLAVGREWVLAGGRDGTLKIFSASDGSRPRKTVVCASEPIDSVALSPDEHMASTGAQDGTVALLEVPSGSRIHRTEAHGGNVEAIAFSPDGRLLATGSKDRTIKLWSVAVGSLRELLTLRSPTGPIHSVTFSPDGKSLLTVARGETAVRVWRLDRLREELKRLGLHWD